MYAKIVNNQIVELSASDYGSDDYVLVPPEVEGADKIYDTNTNSVRAKTAEEIAAELEAVTLSDAWAALRGQRNLALRNTDEFMASDRPETENMTEYRQYLRDLPATYTDSTILEQEPVMTFDGFVASL